MRMLQEAFKLSKEGRAVYVVAVSEHDAGRLRREIGALASMQDPAGRRHGIKVETFEGLGLGPDLERPKGMHPNCVILVDHHALEQRYAAVLQMLTRFDQP